MAAHSDDLVELEIERLAAGGDGVARRDGKVVFVPLTAPGDRVRVRLTRSRPSFAHAELVEVLRPGPGRREPPCPYFGRCGGCSWQHLSQETQAEARAAILLDALRRIGKLGTPSDAPLPAPEWVPSPAPFGYRARARVALQGNRVGFRARRSREVVDVERCPVLHPDTARELRLLRAGPHDAPQGGVEVELRGHGDRVHVGEHVFRVGPGAFFQANALLWESWLERVLRACGGGELAVELYAGVGFYTAGLEKRFARVIAVERGPAARDAQRNSGAQVVDAPAELWAPRELPVGPDLILVNPPRTGCHTDVLNAIRLARARRLVYVSCDPATLARDLGRLSPELRVTELVLLDALPQTHHVETLCVLER